MKNYITVIIAAALVLIGLIGALVCVIPTASAEYKIVDKFVSAIDDCDADAITDCYPVDEMSSMLGGNMGSSIDKTAKGLKSKIDYLKAFCSSAASELPEDAKSVESVELVSCSNAKTQGSEYLKGSSVEAIIKVEYKTADDKTASYTVDKNFTLLAVGNNYKLLG